MKKFFVFMFICFIFTGCPDLALDDESTPIPTSSPTPEPVIINEHFITDETTGVVSFRTNDPRYRNQQGYSFWYILEDEITAFTARESSLLKINGYKSAGYGLIYCFTEEAGEELTMLVVMINTLGEYVVAEINGMVFEEIIPWTESPFLNSGYNQQNRLGLEYNRVTGEYSLFINDHPENLFRDDEAPLHTSGRQGYMVVISPRDDFPRIPVEVQFKEL